MKFLYNISIRIVQFALKGFALVNTKIKAGVKGRAETFNRLEKHLSKTDKTLWFHCASLGEYEQGLPVFEVLKNKYPNHKIVLSFFSPSGYKIRKNSPIADVVVYLPIDTKSNANRFVNLVNPELTMFIKYDVWPNMLGALKARHKKVILISALFRKSQPYFKWYGKFMRKSLFAFTHIFTQNESSKRLLNLINYTDVTVSGDTRFDRVTNQLKQDNHLTFAKNFKQNSLCVVVGSSWQNDIEIMIDYINQNASENLKFIIAPHNVNTSETETLQKKLTVKAICYSKIDSENTSNYFVLIIDTIGLLSKLYNYADIAYIGGAMGNTGLHNTLEAAVFGVPIIIGKHYEKFPEAQQLISLGGMHTVNSKLSFSSVLNALIHSPKKREIEGEINSAFIKNHKGAVNHIVKYLDS